MIAGDKDPAIGKAVEDLEAAGFEVRVLNSAKAKLIDFLGAIAGADEEPDEEGSPEDEVADEPKPKKEPASEPASEPTDELPPEESADEEESDESDPLDPRNLIKKEARISGELVQVVLVDGVNITLHPSSITAGAKTFYALNESQFSFWPGAVSNEPITGGVELSLNGEEITHLTKVIFSEEAMNPPVLKIGRTWLKEAKYPQNSWALLPASKILYNKAKVGVEDIRKEMGSKGVILVCTRDGRGLFLLTSYGHIAKPGTDKMGHNDQTFRNLGAFHVVGTIELGKTAADDKVEHENNDLKKFDPATLKGPVYVFK
jgi:hypothetical protein